MVLDSTAICSLQEHCTASRASSSPCTAMPSANEDDRAGGATGEGCGAGATELALNSEVYAD